MDVNKLKKYVEHRRDTAEKRERRVKTAHGDNPSKDFTYWGGHLLGYHQGFASAMDFVLAKIEQLEGEEQ